MAQFCDAAGVIHFSATTVADLQFEQFVDASPALVGVFFVPQRMPYWYGSEMESKFEVLGGASDFAVGQKVSISGTLASRPMKLTMVVTGSEFGKFLEWQFQDSYGVRGLQSWRLEAGVDGKGTLVRMVDRYENASGLAKLIDKVFTRFAVAKRDRYWLERLKSLAERSGGRS